mgnify:CR=1 FL=1
MCGIAGYTGFKQLSDSNIKQTLTALGRRGPDDNGYKNFIHLNNRATTLLHTRLSIIDLDHRAHQPMKVGKKWISFNGEIYNYHELRFDLSKEGYQFETQSDTEVLLRVIDAWGWDGLAKLEGMWAFVIFDEDDDSLTLCRDRFGEKPLYVMHDDNDGTYFSSEVKALSALSGRRLNINREHIQRYLVNGYKSIFKQPHSFFLGVKPVPSGTAIRIDASGKKTVWKYWQQSLESNDDMTFDEAIDGTRERLIRSVELRLRSDVPLAFCMSGGVDSNALISIAKRELNYDVHGFTISSADERYVEKDMIETSVAELGLRHTTIHLDQSNFLNRLKELVIYHDSPITTVSYYIQWLLLQEMAKCGYKVSISGTAADELFSGYFDHQNLYLYEMRSNPNEHAKSLAAWHKNIKPIVRSPYLKNSDYFTENPFDRRHIYLDCEKFTSWLTKPWREPFWEASYHSSLMRNRMLNELFHESVPPILHDDDLNAMHCSIENRSPFLDTELFSFAQSIPIRHLIKDARAKAVLRESVRGIVVDAIVDNPRKVGFNASIDELLDRSDKSTRKAILNDSPIYELVRKDIIENLLDQPKLSNSRNKFLFSTLSAKMFMEHFN